MGTTAKKTIARYEELLRTIGRCCGHFVNRSHEGTCSATVNDLLDDNRKLNKAYGAADRIDRQILLHDLNLLKEHGWIRFAKDTGPRDSYGGVSDGAPITWLVALEAAGLKYLEELEKTPIRRAYEKNPTAWWMVILMLMSTAAAIAALLKSYGVFGRVVSPAL